MKLSRVLAGAAGRVALERRAGGRSRSRSTVKIGCTTRRTSRPRSASSPITESTRNGMSSLTISSTEIALSRSSRGRGRRRGGCSARPACARRTAPRRRRRVPRSRGRRSASGPPARRARTAGRRNPPGRRGGRRARTLPAAAMQRAARRALRRWRQVGERSWQRPRHASMSAPVRPTWRVFPISRASRREPSSTVKSRDEPISLRAQGHGRMA